MTDRGITVRTAEQRWKGYSMGLNYIVMIWILWHLNAPKWVWIIFAVGFIVDRTLAELEKKLREQP